MSKLLTTPGFHPSRNRPMNRSLKALAALGLGLAPASASRADDASTPSPVPVTREDVKKAARRPRSTPRPERFPLPAPTEEEKAKAAEAAKARAEAAAKAGQPDNVGRAMGGGIVNNGRMRNIYLSDYSANPGGAAGGNRQGRGQGQNQGNFARDGEAGSTYRVPDHALLDRLARQQLHVLPRPPGGQARLRRHDRRPDRGARRRLARVHREGARRVRLHEEAHLRAERHHRRRRRSPEEALRQRPGRRDHRRGGGLQRHQPLDRRLAHPQEEHREFTQAHLGEVRLRDDREPASRPWARRSRAA